MRVRSLCRVLASPTGLYEIMSVSGPVFLSMSSHCITHFPVFGCDSCGPRDSEKHVDGVAHVKRKHLKDLVYYGVRSREFIIL
jgi:hypothetical protein